MMKTTFLLLTLCLTATFALAQDATQPKRNVLSFLRSKKQAQRQASVAQEQRRQLQQTPVAATQPKRGLRFPQFRKPVFSKVRLPKVQMPKMTMPKFKVPKVNAPKWNMPKVSLPKFKGFRKDDLLTNSKDVMREYPGAIVTADGTGYHAIVKDQEVKFYELGPSQSFGPDDYLDQGDPITLISNDRSWAHVVLQDGRTGYVGLDQVRFASTKEVPSKHLASPNYKRQLAHPSASTETESLVEYEPPSSPNVPAPEAQFNPLLDSLNPVNGQSVIIEESLPSDVLVDPSFDPINGGPEPFLEDPLLGTGVPSIEEELRAINALPAESYIDSDSESEPDGGESAEKS